MKARETYPSKLLTDTNYPFCSDEGTFYIQPGGTVFQPTKQKVSMQLVKLKVTMTDKSEMPSTEEMKAGTMFSDNVSQFVYR